MLTGRAEIAVHRTSSFAYSPAYYINGRRCQMLGLHFGSFLWGAVGSLAVEILAIYQHCDRAEVFRIPKKYCDPRFWIIRTLVAGVGGALAMAYDINTPLLPTTI